MSEIVLFHRFSSLEAHVMEKILETLKESTRFPAFVMMNIELKINCYYLARLSGIPVLTYMDLWNMGI